MEIPKTKIQNEKEKFKENFISRLVRFSVDVINFCEKIKGEKRILWPVCDQLLRSATSIGANVMEAKGAGSKKDYTKFFEIALKSANETKYWFMIMKEVCIDSIGEIERLYSELDELSKVTSVLTLKGKNSL